MNRAGFLQKSNVATAHPTAAELRGMPCRRLTTQFYSKSKSFTYCSGMHVLTQLCILICTLVKSCYSFCPNRSRAAGYSD